MADARCASHYDDALSNPTVVTAAVAKLSSIRSPGRTAGPVGAIGSEISVDRLMTKPNEVVDYQAFILADWTV